MFISIWYEMFNTFTAFGTGLKLDAISIANGYSLFGHINSCVIYNMPIINWLFREILMLVFQHVFDELN